METPKPENSPTDLIFNNDGTATYELNEEGDISGTYRGKFTFKCYLDPISELSASRLYREILGFNPQEANDSDKYLAWTLAQLKYRILKAPPFWKTDNSIVDGNIFDKNVIMKLMDKASEAELTYRQNLKKKREEALQKAQSAVASLQESLNPKKKEDEEAK